MDIETDNNFLISVKETDIVCAEDVNEYLAKGYRIIAVQQYQDCDKLIRIQFVVGRS